MAVVELLAFAGEKWARPCVLAVISKDSGLLYGKAWSGFSVPGVLLYLKWCP